MLAPAKAAIKPKIVLLGQNGPLEAADLPLGEGPMESWLAIAQDIWGMGNLTPMDDVFGSLAVRTLAAPSNAIFGAVCYHLGNRLFEFSREAGVWIDAFEGESAVTQIEKRPKDKIKLHHWTPGKTDIKKNRYTHFAVLNAGRIPHTTPEHLQDCVRALRTGGTLFFADLVQTGSKSYNIGQSLHHIEQHRKAFADVGCEVYNEFNMTDEVKLAIFKALSQSLNMLARVRLLKEPWRKQRLHGFYKELEYAAMLYYGLDHKAISAYGMHVIKK